MKPERILVIFLAIVFLVAGLSRLFMWERTLQEFAALGLPAFVAFFIIAFEIICGILLLLNKYLKQVVIALSVFLFLAIILALIRSGSLIFSSWTDLTLFRLDPVTVFLHITYLVILIFLYFHIKNQKA